MPSLKYAFVLSLALNMSAFAMPSQLTADDLTRLAKDMTQQLAAKHYDQVETHFDGTMSAALPATMLAQVWETSLTQLGAFQSIESATEREDHGFRVVLVTTKFANSTINLKWVFGNDGQVAGFFLIPA